MKAKTNQSRQSDFKARQKASGMVRVEVWIHNSKKTELLETVARMKNG